ncbi:MAG TPA: hypothetical protein VH833_03305 [Gemmatimonadales bacterium]|jgi:uncharacterized cupredoxin-like copper-binding protein
MWSYSRAAVALLALLPLVACNRKPAPPATPNVVTITATDYAFQAPDTVPAGLTTFKFTNQGQEPHHVVLMGARAEAGKTMADLDSVMRMEGPPPAWLTLPGSNAVAMPGDSGTVTTTLEAGQYVLVCYIASPDGQMHVMKGMARPFVVTAAAAGAVAPPEPQADIVITEKDYDFELSAPLTAGAHTIRVENAGPQIHEVNIELLAPGKTLADFQAWAAGGMKGEPPTRPVGGLIGPDAGKHGWFTVTLVPGNYLLTCYVPDVQDGKPHVEHGMIKEITVS